MTVHSVVPFSNNGDNYPAFLVLKDEDRGCCYDILYSVRVAWCDKPVGTMQISTKIKFSLTWRLLPITMRGGDRRYLSGSSIVARDEGATRAVSRHCL